MSLSVKLVLLLCIQTPVSRAATPVFVKTGDDVLLTVRDADVPEEFTVLVWKSSADDVLVLFVPGQGPNIRAQYAGRVESGEEKYSVKLRNLQKADSGVYTARLTVAREIILSEYNVTVQDPVSPVQLTVDSVSSSSDSCSITATCSTEDSHISSTFTCDALTCCQEGGNGSELTKSGVSLHIYLLNESVICSHSNQVSQAKTTARILYFCLQHLGSETLFGVSVCLLKKVVFSVGLIIMVLAVICVHLMEKLKKLK